MDNEHDRIRCKNKSGVRIIKEVVQNAGGNIKYTKEEGNNICAEVFLPFIGNF